MLQVLDLGLLLICALLCAILRASYSIYASLLRNPLRTLPGPQSPSLLWGYARHLWTTNPTRLHEEWVQKYGRTLTYRALSYRCLYTLDTKALGHILVHTGVYQKPLGARTYIATLLGNGTILSEDEQHRRQVKLENPAFGPLQIRTFTELFLSKTSQLCNILSSELAHNHGAAHVDIYDWLHRLSLDIIGKAAFNYDIGALDVNTESNELRDAFWMVAQSVKRMSLYPMLRFFFPILRILPEEQSTRAARARRVTAEFARKLVQEKRRELATDPLRLKPSRSKRGDFLALLVEATTDAALAPRERLSDETIIDGDFLTAGHETSAITIAWFIYCLACDQSIQDRLRNEVFSMGTDNPTYEQLSAMRYLDNVCREVVRLYPAVHSTLRMAMKDDLLPLGEPIQVNGELIDRIYVPKGTPIIIPIRVINRDRALWGEDSHEFKPDRWDALPEAVSSIPGIWANNLTFLGGQHACLGFRFALVEIKAVIFTLLRAFVFHLAVPKEDIGETATLLMRPARISEGSGCPQLPLVVRAYSHE
ncbi:cytochrome P450 [Trametes sanguinea]|nr:cytochrome P450 [Trametes sanguinea]